MQPDAEQCDCGKSRLKIRRGQPHGGSIPPPGTKISSVKETEFKMKASQTREAFTASKHVAVIR
jgi:hypothetical protein